jgi:hypothetical protein
MSSRAAARDSSAGRTIAGGPLGQRECMVMSFPVLVAAVAPRAEPVRRIGIPAGRKTGWPGQSWPAGSRGTWSGRQNVPTSMVTGTRLVMMS